MRDRNLFGPIFACLLTIAIVGGALAPPLASGSEVASDPLAAGPHSYSVVEYDAGLAVLASTNTRRPGASPQRLRGVLFVPSGDGPFPVVVLLHGRHTTCRIWFELLLHPCPDTPVTSDIRSYRGYDDLAANLASHGYLVASADANGINSYDLASLDSGQLQRTELIGRTLDLLHDWNESTAPGDVSDRLVGRVDLSRIGLMGHSRGGEGVTAFVDYNRAREGRRYPGLKAVFALAATDFFDWAPSGVAFGALLPLCDGDVSDLQGADAYDRGRFARPDEPSVRAQYTVSGANHNFFNAEWTFDDYEFGPHDSACSAQEPANVRLDPHEQRRVGIALMAGFLRANVGAEEGLEGIVTGRLPLPPSACPRAELDCRTIVRTSYLAPAEDRLMLITPRGDGTELARTDTGGTITATGFDEFEACDPVRAECPTTRDAGVARQLTLAWSGPASVRAQIGSRTDVRRFNSLTFRTETNFNDERNGGSGQNLVVTLVDDDGTRSSVDAASYTDALRSPEGTNNRRAILDGVAIPLTAFSGVDLTAVTAVELHFGDRTQTGSIQLAELAFQR